MTDARNLAQRFVNCALVACLSWLSAACAKTHTEAPSASSAEVGGAPAAEPDVAHLEKHAVEAQAFAPTDAAAQAEPKSALAPTPTSKPAAACSPRTSSTLPGVSIQLFAKRCRYAQVEISKYTETAYELRIDRPLTGVKPYAYGDEVLVDWPSFSGAYRVGCGDPEDASNLMVAEWIRGPTGSLYCVCDFGRCAPNDVAAKDVQPGVYKHRFRWIGKTFRGPSDTGEVPAEPFVPGNYELSLRVDGSYLPAGSNTRQPFHAEAILPITVTP